MRRPRRRPRLLRPCASRASADADPRTLPPRGRDQVRHRGGTAAARRRGIRRLGKASRRRLRRLLLSGDFRAAFHPRNVIHGFQKHLIFRPLLRQLLLTQGKVAVLLFQFLVVGENATGGTVVRIVDVPEGLPYRRGGGLI